jgi:hypothetical protein
LNNPLQPPSPIFLPSICREFKTKNMAATIVTIEDLLSFKQDLIHEVRLILQDSLKQVDEKKEEKKNEKSWLKSNQVQRMLAISPSTLQNLRLTGKIPYTKIGGVIFYPKEDINQLLESKIRNRV